MSLRVLISAAGRRVALLRLFKDEVRRLGLDGQVLAADASPLAAAMHDADAHFLVPPCGDGPAFVSTLLELCEEHKIGLVIPTIDPELPLYADQRRRFEAIGVTIAVSALETVAIGHDKQRTHEWLVSQGFPTIRQATVASIVASPDDWRWPLIVKPRRGSASIGVQRVASASELSAAARDGEFVVQEVARGNEHTVDVLVQRDGQCVCAVPRRRLEVRAGEVSKAVTVRDAAIEKIATDVAQRLPGAYGVLNLQLFHDPSSGDIRVIEINARFGGGYPLAHRAGAPMVRWLLEEVAGMPSSATNRDWQPGVVMLRFDDAVFVDAAQAGLSA